MLEDHGAKQATKQKNNTITPPPQTTQRTKYQESPTLTNP